jgi:hypothetical protein
MSSYKNSSKSAARLTSEQSGRKTTPAQEIHPSHGRTITNLLMLQRVVGNRFVQRLLQTEQISSTSSPSHYHANPRAFVQRRFLFKQANKNHFNEQIHVAPAVLLQKVQQSHPVFRALVAEAKADKITFGIRIDYDPDEASEKENAGATVISTDKTGKPMFLVNLNWTKRDTLSSLQSTLLHEVILHIAPNLSMFLRASKSGESVTFASGVEARNQEEREHIDVNRWVQAIVAAKKIGQETFYSMLIDVLTQWGAGKVEQVLEPAKVTAEEMHEAISWREQQPGYKMAPKISEQ